MRAQAVTKSKVNKLIKYWLIFIILLISKCHSISAGDIHVPVRFQHWASLICFFNKIKNFVYYILCGWKLARYLQLILNNNVNSNSSSCSKNNLVLVYPIIKWNEGGTNFKAPNILFFSYWAVTNSAKYKLLNCYGRYLSRMLT